MTPDQLYVYVTVVPATTMIIVLVGVLLQSNTVNRRMNDLGDVIVPGAFAVHADRWDLGLRRLENIALEKFAELNNRLSRIESHLNLH
jgi:hypothetical protein